MTELEPPTNSPIFTKIDFATVRPWQVLRPRVYRFLEKKWVDAFFEDGSLRLSSFAMFSKHDDEQRKDRNEGFNVMGARGPKGSAVLVGGVGHNSYVMCGTAKFTDDIRESLNNYDACFSIDDTLAFSFFSSLKLPSFIGGAEGFAIYQNDRSIVKGFTDDFDMKEFMEKYTDSMGNLSMDMLLELHGKMGGIEQFFISEIGEFIDIKVPEARKFCRRVFCDQSYAWAANRRLRSH